MNKISAPLVLCVGLWGAACTHDQPPPATPASDAQTPADNMGPERHAEPIHPTDGTAPDATNGTQTSAP